MGLLLALLSLPMPAGTLRAEVRDAAGKRVSDAVVLLTPSGGPKGPASPAKRQEVDQIQQEFVPYVKVIPLGSDVYFPNKDNIRHQVYSFSPSKRFELPLYAGRSAPPVRFDKPGVVVLGCNIHDWMVAYLYVTDAPYFALTGTEGAVTFENLAPGEFTARVWHPQQKESEASTLRKITINAEDAASVKWMLTLLPDARPRRHPGVGGSDYR